MESIPQRKNSLIENSKNIPIYNFLTNDFGCDLLKEYSSFVKQKFANNPNLLVLKFEHNIVRGSNIYSACVMDKLLSRYKLRAPTLSDAQKIVDHNTSFLRNVYVDLGLVLRTEEGKNDYLAKQLGKQAKAFGYTFSKENPLVFQISDLELIKDNHSPFELSFNIKESAEPFNAKELSKEYNNKKFYKTDKRGIPIFDKNGKNSDEIEKRTNFIQNGTESDGLLGVYLGWWSDLISWLDDFSYSCDGGRIVTIKK